MKKKVKTMPPSLSLTAVEHGLLRGAQWMTHRWVLRCVLVALGLCLLGVVWGAVARRGGADEDEEDGEDGGGGEEPPRRATTLLDPQRLQATFNLFTEGGLQPQPQPGRRHRTEAVCRELLEDMIGAPFPKGRPKWLVNPTTKRPLELDMFNADHRLAFEYDGCQHDQYTPHFHQSEEHFQYRRLLDRLKAELCTEHGVRLVRIPWNEVSHHDRVKTARFLEDLLQRHGIPHRSVGAHRDQGSVSGRQRTHNHTGP